MRISDWSSDVCSSDLSKYPHQTCSKQSAWRDDVGGVRVRRAAARIAGRAPAAFGHFHGAGAGPGAADRKSVVSGKSVSVRVDPGGRRIIKKKTQENM